MLFAVIGGYGLTQRSSDMDLMAMNEAEAVDTAVDVICNQGAIQVFTPTVSPTATPINASGGTDTAIVGSIGMAAGINSDPGAFTSLVNDPATHVMTWAGKFIYGKKTGFDCEAGGLQAVHTLATAVNTTALPNSTSIKFSTVLAPTTGVGLEMNVANATDQTILHKATTGLVGLAAVVNGDNAGDNQDYDDGTNLAVHSKDNSIAAYTGLVVTFNATDDSPTAQAAKGITIGMTTI